MSANLAVRPLNRYRRRAAVFSFFIILDGRAAGGGQRGHVASDINDDDFEEVMVHEIGRSHSGGHIAYDKHVHEGKRGLAKLAKLFFVAGVAPHYWYSFLGASLPSIKNHYTHNGGRVSNNYPNAKMPTATFTTSSSGLGDSLSRSPSAGLNGRVDWKSKYLK